MKLRFQKIIAFVLLAIAVGLLAASPFVSHRAFDPDTEEFGLQAFTRLSEMQLVVDTTFGGVMRKGDKLFSTYDRTVARGKRSCPT